MTAIIPIPTRSDLEAAIKTQVIAASSLEIAEKTGLGYRQAFEDKQAADRNVVRIQAKLEKFGLVMEIINDTPTT